MEVGGQLHAPAALTLGEQPNWMGGWVWALRNRDKSFAPAAQLAACHYTDWATSDHLGGWKFYLIIICTKRLR
jgi:hypothetical protein